MSFENVFKQDCLVNEGAYLTFFAAVTLTFNR